MEIEMRTMSFLLLSTLALALGGCNLFPGFLIEESDDDNDAADDDSATGDDDTTADDDDSSLPADDDDTATDDDDATEDPCEGFDRDVDWDCDGNADVENGESYFPDPYNPRALFRDDTVSWTSDSDEVSGAGYGYGGDADEDPSDWGFDPESRPIALIGDGDFWEAELDPYADGDEDGCTVYRHTLRGEGVDQWADLACEGPNADPACLADCEDKFAMAVVACDWGTHVASAVERVDIPDTGLDCPSTE
jgi:hypothetical protein